MLSFFFFETYICDRHYLALLQDTTCVPLGYQCYITLANEGVPRNTSHACLFSFLFRPSYVAHLHWPMLYNIGIPMVHKWCPTVAWYAQLITVAMNERWNFVCGILCFLKDENSIFLLACF